MVHNINIMDHKFTEQIKQWLETSEDERDYSVGALYLLKLSGNQIMRRFPFTYISFSIPV